MAHLPPLNALRAFEVSSRSSSFTIAADELCISQGAVSRHIAHLEEYLGEKLFIRNHKQLTLTARGAEYAKELQLVFANIRKATDAVRQRSQRQTIRIALFPTVATQWLSSRVARFHTLHPNVDLIVRTSIGSIDNTNREFDVVNRRGPIADQDMEYIPLFNIMLNPVCSPELLRRGPPLKTPSDLRGHVLLHSLNRGDDWKLWFEHAGLGDVEVSKGMEFDNTALSCQAAMGSAGVAMGIIDMLDENLLSANLVQPFHLPYATGETYGFAIRHESLDNPNIRAFCDWVRAELAADSGARQAMAAARTVARSRNQNLQRLAPSKQAHAV